MEQLMGNENIAALQKEALSDPGMKAAVEQVLKNPEMLNEFKNFFKGGGKWKKRRTRRRRGANGSDDEDDRKPRSRRFDSSDEEILEAVDDVIEGDSDVLTPLRSGPRDWSRIIASDPGMLQHKGKKMAEQLQNREFRTAQYFQIEEKKRGLYIKRETLTQEYIKTMEEKEKAGSTKLKKKLDNKLLFIMNAIEQTNKGEEKLDNEQQKLKHQSTGIRPALYGGKRRRKSRRKRKKTKRKRKRRRKKKKRTRRRRR